MKALMVALLIASTPIAAQAERPAYRAVGSVPLGAPDRWDYVTVDGDRVYVAHGDTMTVVDGRKGIVIGHVMGVTGGTHGSAIAGHIAFTDDGEAGAVIAFDPATFAITHRIPADADADGMAMDPASGHLFVVSGDPGTLTVIDPRAAKPVATIKAGEKMEYLASDGHGFIYVAGEDKSDILKIDTRTNAIAARWATPDCVKPHGLAIDPVRHRVFMGCVNALMMVIDGGDGHIVAKLPIGHGSDAIAYDPVRRRVFSSNGLDGTISIYQQVGADGYLPLAPVPTAVTGRTMAVDPTSGRLFVAAGDIDHARPTNEKPKIISGSLRLFMFDLNEDIHNHH